jgi:5S rRNA maturation endonuclease (ribonuclease M5)
VLIHCHAGCSQWDVIEALKALGLWKSDGSRELSFLERIECTYDYIGEDRKLLYQIVRLHSPKDFRQRRPDGLGNWIWRKHPQQVLYHLPEVLEAPIVFVVEGERDVETLRSWGFVATTNAGGAKAPWLPSYTQALCGREVIIIPDDDAPGKQRTVTIARALLGKVARTIVLELNGAKDISDWFAAGHSETELIAHVEGEAVSS